MKRNIMNNNIIYIALAMIIGISCAATSCASGMEPETVERGDEIQVEVNQPASRSVVTNNSILKQHPFMICGDINRTGEYYPGLKVIFNGRKVEYKGDEQTGKWDYGTPIYWLMGQEHSFVAIHPYLDAVLGITDWSYSDSKLAFTYTVPKNEDGITDYDKMWDILFATHRRNYNMDNAGAIKFVFRHLMSQINIEPALNEELMYPDETNKDMYPDNQPEFIQIKRFELYGLKTSAKFSFTPDPLENNANQTDACHVTYEVDDNSKSHAVMSFKGVKQVTNNQTHVNICKDDDTLLVLPQEVDQEEAEIVLYYTINTDHQDDNVVRKITFPLHGLPITKWESGKIYTYRFTVEKAYTGQIKDGSITWEVKDSNITDDDKKNWWIDDDDTISQEFNIDDKE